MLGLANERLVMEAFNGLGAQIAALKNIEQEDMENITANFIDLKNKVDIESLERIKLSQALNTIIEEFKNFKSAVNSMDKELRINKKDTPCENKIAPVEQAPTQVHSNIFGYCITCEKEMEMLDVSNKALVDGGKMTSGPCIKCGRILFKIS